MIAEQRTSRPRVERVDPYSFADDAARVLEASWKPNCLRYSADYLRWEFRFPGNSSVVGRAIMSGEDPVGFIAAMPRRLRFGAIRSGVHLLSFVAVRPEYRGPLPVVIDRALLTDPLPNEISESFPRLSVALYQILLAELKGSGLPVVAFAQAGTVGEKVLVENLTMAGYRIGRLGTYPTYASPVNLASQATAPEIAVEEVSDPVELPSVFEACAWPQVAWSDPDAAQLAHYGKDPRGRAIVMLRDRAGAPIGAAMVVLSEIVTAAGLGMVSMIDSLFLPDPSPDALKALLRFAGRRWPDQVSSPTITAPNLWGIRPEILRAAGLRAVSPGFRGYIACKNPDDPLLKAEATNLEIV